MSGLFRRYFGVVVPIAPIEYVQKMQIGSYHHHRSASVNQRSSGQWIDILLLHYAILPLLQLGLLNQNAHFYREGKGFNWNKLR